MSSPRRHFGYVMYWGALEPVGQATAVPTVLGMAEEARMTLVSFEKPGDWSDEGLVERTRARLEEAGVRWLPQEYAPGYATVPRDVVRGFLALRRAHREEPMDAVEGRTFVGGMIGAAAARWLSIPFLYHTEGCWLDEQIDTGRLSPSSPVLRLLRGVERWTVGAAGAFVVLTEAGEARLRERELRARPDAPVLRVPTTSVLVESAPEPGDAPVVAPGEPVHAVYAGSVTGRYLLDEMLTFVEMLTERRPGSRLRLLAHRDRDVVHDALVRHGLEEVAEVGAVPHDRLGEELRGKDFGMFFLEEGLSEPCVSPTKIPEYLAFGVPVVTTRASGDGAGLVERREVGAVVEDPGSRRDMARALDRLDELLQDPHRARRARAAARDHYSLGRAVHLQSEALRRLAEEGR